MSEFVEIMLGPLIACILLTGIHAYLGIHVLSRGVIFVDLALAQVAAFGATVGFLLGFGLHSTGSYLISLAFSVAGAALFAVSRSRDSCVPQEAYIGILYAIASAATILVLSRAPEGGEELKSLLVGHLLFVEWREIAYLLVLYSIVGLFHWRYFSIFMLLSSDYGGTGSLNSQTSKLRWWDFCFYASLGVVVTSSTEIAGVLLVFSFLVVPAVCGVLLASTIRTRLLIGWLVGIITSTIGMLCSYLLDLPSGATVVCVFGLCLLVCLALRASRRVIAGAA